MPYYVIIRGPLGSGKSTVAARLSKTLKGRHISIDRILASHGLEDDHEDGYISQKSFVKANAIAAARAKKIMKSNIPVVFDGNFYWKSQIEDLIDRMDCRHYTFTLKAPLRLCIARDSMRKKPLGKKATAMVFKKTTSFDYGIGIDATRTVECITKEMLSHCNSKR
jgi:predicted kinase